ncbi:MAG: polysaccharide deacetylase family protein [Hyphomicrobiaceae bacterium]
MRRNLLSLLSGLAICALGPAAAEAACSSAAIGTSRQVTINAAGAPRFGHSQYPGPHFLNQGEVVLTFDDGPHRQLTPKILSVLDEHCAKATFFMVGQRAMMYPGLVREVARRGHTIATHTWSHRDLRKSGHDVGIAEIELGISGVQRALGQPAAPFFRFPYLSDPSYAIQHLKARNTAIFSIDVDSFDFRTRSPTVVMRNVMKQLKAKGRGIILFHDIQPSTAGALAALLGDMKAEGYRVVHVVPQAQTTLAAYDKRVGSKRIGQETTASLPLSRRAAVSPAWEPRTYPTDAPRAHPSAVHPTVAAGVVAQAPHQVQRPRPVAPRQASKDDWRVTIFRGY